MHFYIFGIDCAIVLMGKTIKILFLSLLVVAASSYDVRAEFPVKSYTDYQKQLTVPGSFRGPGPNVKLIPAMFFWNTLGLEFEIPMGLLSFGAVGMYKFNERYGDIQNLKFRPEDYQKSGFRAEVFARYYYRGEAPVGLFAEGKIFYNNIIYFDGNPMPYTLYNRWKDLNGLREPSEVYTPQPFGLGIATGIQVQVVPNIIIANLKAGLDINQDSPENGEKVFLSIYLQPSIGITF